MPRTTSPVIRKSSSLPTALIAGGAGFLGSHLAEKLLQNKCRVVVVDNLSTGRRSFIQPLIPHPRFLFFDVDIRKDLPREIESVDYIFHLAALEVHLSGRREISLESLLTNAWGTRNLLRLAKKSQAKFLLASSIDVYRGVLSSESFENYFGATPEEERKFIHAEAKRFAEALTWEAFEKDGLDARIVRLGEVYGPRMDFSSAGTLGRLLQELLGKRELIVYGEGLEKEYYTHVNDVVRGIIKAAFLENTAGKIFPITTLEPVTPLELVYLLREISGEDLRVVFKPSPHKTPLSELKVVDGNLQRELQWKPKIPLREGIAEVLREARPAKREKKPRVIQKIAVGKKEKESKSRVWRWPRLPRPSQKVLRFLGAAVLLAFGSLTLLPSMSLAFNVYSARRGTLQLEKDLRKLDLERAEQDAIRVGENLRSANQDLDKLRWVFALLGKSRQERSLGNFLQAASFLFQAVSYEVRGVQPLSTAFLNLLASGSELSPTEITSATSDFTEAQERILLAEAHLKKTDPQHLTRWLSGYHSHLEKTIRHLRENTPLLKTVALSLPELLGSKTKKTYLLIFQNSNELRPTGGFIGSYGKLVLNRGRVDKLVVDDVYNIDGLLETKGVEIPPPAPLRDHLGVSRWLLRDANWSPDFPTAAEQIRHFYSLATGEQADGVIALDLQFVRELLSLVGPVYLAQFNETIDAQNFFEKAEFYSEANYFPGSPQKKTFLSLLSAKLLEKVFKLDAEGLVRLAQVAGRSLSEKHLLLFLPKSEISSLLAARGWDGGMRQEKGDYLMVVDANVGATKANYYVKRSLNYAVRNIDRRGTLEAELTLHYVHGAASNTWPGGAYKNYLRVYVPQGSVLKRVERSSEGVDSKALEITSEVDQTEEGGKTVFGTVFTLDAGRSLSLTFTYNLPEEVSLSAKENTYNLLLQKQAGTTADPLTVDFLKPFGRDVVSAPEGAKRIGDLWRWSGNLRVDRELRYELQ